MECVTFDVTFENNNMLNDIVYEKHTVKTAIAEHNILSCSVYACSNQTMLVELLNLWIYIVH